MTYYPFGKSSKGYKSEEEYDQKAHEYMEEAKGIKIPPAIAMHAWISLHLPHYARAIKPAVSKDNRSHYKEALELARKRRKK